MLSRSSIVHCTPAKAARVNLGRRSSTRNPLERSLDPVTHRSVPLRSAEKAKQSQKCQTPLKLSILINPGAHCRVSNALHSITKGVTLCDCFPFPGSALSLGGLLHQALQALLLPDLLGLGQRLLRSVPEEDGLAAGERDAWKKAGQKKQIETSVVEKKTRNCYYTREWAGTSAPAAPSLCESPRPRLVARSSSRSNTCRRNRTIARRDLTYRFKGEVS